MTPNLLPPVLEHQDYINNLSTKLSSSISTQKDSIIFEVLKENNAPIYDLTVLMKSCRFIKIEGTNYQVFSYGEKNLLMILKNIYIVLFVKKVG